MTPSTRRALARCIREQRACRRYLRERGFTGPPGDQGPRDGGTAGAWLGLCDWLMEEVILRCQR